MHLRRTRLLLVAAVIAAVASGAVGYELWLRAQHITKLEAVPDGSLLPVPAVRPVILIVLENKNEADILDAVNAPAIRHLIASGAKLTDSQGVAHPSQPNYLALFSGSTQGVIDDEPHDVSAPNLADQLESAGRTWRIYAEDLPAGPCFTGAVASKAAAASDSPAGSGPAGSGPAGSAPAGSGPAGSGPYASSPDGPGVYARKHNPAMSFTSITGSPSRCANVQPLAAFSPDAADFIWVVPNLCHSMHDCSVAAGDAWLSSFLPRITSDPAFGPGGRGLLIVTFDEGDDRSRNNEIVTILDSPLIAPGTTSDVAHSHYSILRSIETAFGLPCLADACGANTVGEVFAH